MVSTISLSNLSTQESPHSLCTDQLDTKTIEESLYRAVQARDYQKITSALQAGANPNCLLDHHDTSAVGCAVLSGEIEVTKALCDSGKEYRHRVNWNRPCNRLGWYPIHLATERTDEAMIRWLCIMGAKVSVCMPDGRTALHLAVCHGFPRIIVLLESLGIKPDIIDNYGFTAGALARMAGREKCYKALPVLKSTHQILAIKWASHTHGLKGKVRLGLNEIDAEGGAPTHLRKQLTNFLERAGSCRLICDHYATVVGGSYPEKFLTTAFEAQMPEKAVARVRGGEPYVQIAGGHNHVLALLFFCDEGDFYFCVCNRGYRGVEDQTYGTYEVYPVVIEKLEPSIFEVISNQITRPIKDNINFYYEELPPLLGPIPRSEQGKNFSKICEDASEIAMKDSKVGNCAWAAQKAALRFLLYLLLKRSKAESMELSKKLSTGLQLQSLCYYSSLSESDLDLSFLQRCMEKLQPRVKSLEETWQGREFLEQLMSLQPNEVFPDIGETSEL